jgi:hypothetical protein
MRSARLSRTARGLPASIAATHVTVKVPGSPPGHTKTKAGLRVKAGMDKAKYPTGRTISKAQMGALALHKHAFHGEWNYELRPRPS